MVVVVIILAIVVVLCFALVTQNKNVARTSNSRRRKEIDDFFSNDVMKIIDIDIKIEKLRAANKEWERLFNYLMVCQSTGMKLEQEKDIDGAISFYEQAVEFGKSTPRLRINDYFYSIRRLAILYRKKKEYDKEIMLVKYFLDKTTSAKDYEELEHRLERAILLLEKSGGMLPTIETDDAKKQGQNSQIGTNSTFIFPTGVNNLSEQSDCNNNSPTTFPPQNIA